MASTAPAAPRVCPVAPFVDEMGVRRALSSPSASFKTRVSPASPAGRRRSVRVDVPDLLRGDVRFGEGHLHCTRRVLTRGIGSETWFASEEMP